MTDSHLSEISSPTIVPKPWGEELWVARTDSYVGKLLHINKGCRLSLQYHERKHETQYVLSGRVRYTIGDQELVVKAGTSVVLAPGTIHRMEALERAVIMEVSTPELSDVIRLEDDYGRASGEHPAN